jgi:hypothetical protein
MLCKIIISKIFQLALIRRRIRNGHKGLLEIIYMEIWISSLVYIM